jgi:TIR domain/Carbohydrate binding module (family 35)
MRDFFISYNKADGIWAEWIAWQLEEAGYTTILQAWDFRPSENFVRKMNEAVQDSERLVAVLSPDYLSAPFTLPEWSAAFVQDPTSDKGKLLPVRVRECELTGLFGAIIHVDLVGRDEAEAKEALLSGIKRERAKPPTEPKFPGGVPRSVSTPPLFPGISTRKIPTKPLIALALLLVLLGAGVYVLRHRFFTRRVETPRPCPKSAAGETRYYEAEDAHISGDASEDIGHEGFSGDGFVSGYGGLPGATTTFLVDVPSDGQYQVALCYANGTPSARTLTIYVNEEPLKQTRLPNAPRWNIWLTQTESLPLRAGRNAISYRKTPSDNGQVNLDFIGIAQEPTIYASPQPTATPTPTQTATATPQPSTSPPAPQSRSSRRKVSRPKTTRCSAERRLLGLC